ncbi:uncharacterized protein LOC135810218 isoform X2 [Sycon ciliatum]|uniref:uncharacterized protein LOC135810218 isoform X2 n=1 Tax=Sycon ciliatum TaxID=27933 RepID=UPI0031F660BD
MSGAAATGGEEKVFNAEDRRVRVLNPRKTPAGGHPVHASIFQVRSRCVTCCKIGIATCFMVEQLNKGRDHPCYYFTTAAHVIFCSDCGEYRWAQIVYEWDPKDYKPSSTFPPDGTVVEENNDRGWLRVPEDYIKNCGKGEWDRYPYDYGIIALRKDNLEQRLKNELDKLSGENAMVHVPMAQQPRMESVDQAFLCGFPAEVKNEKVLGHMYWVPVDKSKKAEPLQDDISFKKRRVQERETSALFAMPQRHMNDGDGDRTNKISSNQELVVKRLYRHYIDSSAGQAGSPVYCYNDEDKEYVVYGIHTGRWLFSDAKSNLYCKVAVRIQEVYKDMSKWIELKEADEQTAPPAQKHSTEGSVEKKQTSYLFGTGTPTSDEPMDEQTSPTIDKDSAESVPSASQSHSDQASQSTAARQDDAGHEHRAADGSCGTFLSTSPLLKVLSEITDFQRFSRSMEGCISRLKREDFAQAVAILINPEYSNDFKDDMQDFIMRNDLGTTNIPDNMQGVIRWAVDQAATREITLAELKKIALDLNPERKKRIEKTFQPTSDEPMDEQTSPTIDKAELDDIISTCNVELRRLRIFFCGKYGTGKSTLIGVILGDEYEQNKDSTEGVNVRRTLATLPANDSQEDVALLPKFSCIKKNELSAQLMTAAIRHQQQQRQQQLVGGIKPGDEAAFGGSSAAGLEAAAAEASTTQEDISISAFKSSNDSSHTPDGDSHMDMSHNQEDRTNELPWPLGLFHGIDDDLKEGLQQIRTEEDQTERTSVEFWDCGGQLAMATQQSICLASERAMFVITFDASKDLRDKVDTEVFRYDKGKTVSIEPLFPGMTHEDFLLMWLSTVSLRMQQSPASTNPNPEAAKTTSVHTAQQSRTGTDLRKTKPKVFLVATHIDLVDDVEEKKKEIIAVVKGISKRLNSAHLQLVGPYFVSNKQPGHPASEMSTFLEDLTEDIRLLEPDMIPLNQMKLEKAITMLQVAATPKQQQTPRPNQTPPDLRMHATFAELKELAKFMSNGSMSDKEFRAALSYYHHIGVVICSDWQDPTAKSLVFLNVDWLLQLFVQLVVLSYDRDNSDRRLLDRVEEIEALQEEGRLSTSLLAAVWKLDQCVQQSLMEIMCHFGLASEILATEPTEYLLPFCISERGRAKTLPANLRYSPPLLVMKFSCAFFPPAVFSRMVIYCVSNKPHEGIRDPVVEYAAITFKFGRQHHVRISWFPIGLLVEVKSSSKSKEEVIAATHQLLRVIKHSLGNLNDQGFVGLEWTHCFQCQRCISNVVDGDDDAGESGHSSRPSTPERTTTSSRQLRRDIGLIELSGDDLLDYAEMEDDDTEELHECKRCKEHTSLPCDYVHYWIRSHSSSTSDAAGNSSTTTRSNSSRNHSSNKRNRQHAGSDSRAAESVSTDAVACDSLELSHGRGGEARPGGSDGEYWFKSPKYVSDIRPWLCDLPAANLRRTLEKHGLLTLSQVHTLMETERLHGKERHNCEMLLESVESAGEDGFVELYNAIEKSTSLTQLFIRIGLKRMREAMPDE